MAPMSPIDKSPREASGATTHNPRKTFCRANGGALPFPSAVINDTVPRFPFSFPPGDKHAALYRHGGVLSSRQSVVALSFRLFFLELQSVQVFASLPLDVILTPTRPKTAEEHLLPLTGQEMSSMCCCVWMS